MQSEFWRGEGEEGVKYNLKSIARQSESLLVFEFVGARRAARIESCLRPVLSLFPTHSARVLFDLLPLAGLQGRLLQAGRDLDSEAHEVGLFGQTSLGDEEGGGRGGSSHEGGALLCLLLLEVLLA